MPPAGSAPRGGGGLPEASGVGLLASGGARSACPRFSCPGCSPVLVASAPLPGLAVLVRGALAGG
eukprot:267620-Rhodomonas_salina.1